MNKNIKTDNTAVLHFNVSKMHSRRPDQRDPTMVLVLVLPTTTAAHTGRAPFVSKAKDLLALFANRNNQMYLLL